MDDDDNGEPRATWRTVFFISADYDGVSVDFAVSYDKADELQDAIKAERVAARLNGGGIDVNSLEARFPEAFRAAEDVSLMSIRARTNMRIKGPFNVLADHALTDEEMIAWFKMKHPRG